MMRMMINRAIQSDTKTGLALLELALRMDQLESPVNDDAASPDDEAVLAAYRKRHGADGGHG